MSAYGVRAESLICPIAPRANKLLDGLEASGIRWVEQFSLAPNSKALKKISTIKVSNLTAQTYPDCDQELLNICNDMLIWFFVCDDQFDERELGTKPQKMEKICANFMRLLESGNERAAISPLARALLDLRNRVWARSAEPWRSRFLASMALYFEGCMLESENRARGLTPDFDEYQRIRRASVGTYPCFDLIELGLVPALEERLVLHPGLGTVRDLATDMIAWINDIVSYAKESAYDDPHNLITVLMRECGISREAAEQKTVEYHNSKYENIDQIIRGLRREESDPAFRMYISGIESWIRGVLDWSFASARYKKVYITLSQSTSHVLLSDE